MSDLTDIKKYEYIRNKFFSQWIYFGYNLKLSLIPTIYPLGKVVEFRDKYNPNSMGWTLLLVCDNGNSVLCTEHEKIWERNMFCDVDTFELMHMVGELICPFKGFEYGVEYMIIGENKRQKEFIAIDFENKPILVPQGAFKIKNK